MSQSIIKVENLSKQYRIGEVGTGTISHDLNRWWHRIRGKEDPYLRIGESNDRSKKGNSEYVWALQDINFEVQQGEVLGIIGKNGAGKSTLLKILSKVTAPTTGSIKAKGRIAALLEVGTGFHPELTGRENIYLNGTILGMTKREVTAKLDEIIDFSGVERYLDTPVKRYSSGMMVRLGFAVAAHLEPEILIVDEVLAVGDSEFQKKCIGKMGEVSKEHGRTILFVSHQMGVMNQLCKNGMYLTNGKFEFIGKIREVTSRYLEDNKVDTLLDDRKDKSSNYIYKMSLVDDKGNIKNIFTYSETKLVKIEFIINKHESGQQIGLALDSKHGGRIFTVIRKVDLFLNDSKISTKFIGEFELPDKLIAPNDYTFTVVLWREDGHIYDIKENTCSIKIIDDGTEFSKYEGLDYGHIIIQPKWNY